MMMKRRPRRAALLVSGALVATSLWSGAGNLAAPTLALPSLSLSEVLSLARVAAPPAGTGLKIHADFPAGRPFDVDGVKVTSLSVDITPIGNVVITNMIRRGASGGSTADGGTPECDDREFTPEGVRWPKSAMPLKWVFDAASTPEPMSQWRSELMLVEAHDNWANTNNRCQEGDSIDFSFEYAGRTRRGVARDGYNSVGFGRLGGEAIAMNYLWYVGTEAVETDLRLRKQDWMWANRPEVNQRYQTINVATHEIGHQIGLDDLGGTHSKLTMYGVVSRGELGKTTLGRGDLRGAALLSPKL
jgi:hypothetical protein